MSNENIPQAPRIKIGWLALEAAPEDRVPRGGESWSSQEATPTYETTPVDKTRNMYEAAPVRQATQVDESRRAHEAAPARQATQVDESRRAHEAAPARQATQVDESWRAHEAAPARQATQVDESRRAHEAAPARQATQVDESWRAHEAAPARQATQVDESWRAHEAAPVRQETPTAPDFSEATKDPLGAADIMHQATANGFASIVDFQEAAATLSVLVSSQKNTYSVKKVISSEGGESSILLCAAPDGNDVVAKVYYKAVSSTSSSIPARVRLLEYMHTQEGRKYALPVTEIGLVELNGGKYYFEIMPYCKEGDLSHAEPFSFTEIVALTKHLNEALHSIHQAGILHRDLKPENLYQYEGRVVIGDFGVAQLVKAGATRVTVGSDGYRPPESVLAVTAGESVFFFDEKCDYYSLGVTLGSLFEGRFVYDGMTATMITAAVRNGKIPLTKNDPHREQLENLLNGLCRYDSNYRFAYEDVNRWLADYNYTGGVLDEEWPRPFRMFNEEYRDEKSLFIGITKDEAHWNEGKDMLYRKFFENFFISFRTDLARAAQVADEVYRVDDRDKGVFVFLKKLFAPGPIVWKGHTFNSLKELGNKMVTTSTPAAYGEILQKRCISHWLENTEGIRVDGGTQTLVSTIEALANTDPEIACYWFGNSFAANRILRICDRDVRTISELIEALVATPRIFYQGDGLTKLLSRQKGADLYGFLFSFGYRQIIDDVWGNLEGCNITTKTSLLFSMIESIAISAKVDATPIRNFFVAYGSIGIAVYTKKLVCRERNKVYIALDVDGKQALSKIADFQLPAVGSISEMVRAYTPLIESVEKLKKLLIDNPYCVMTGLYEKKGVICTNLIGCFAFRIYKQLAPLGFSAWIESADGGK